MFGTKMKIRSIKLFYLFMGMTAIGFTQQPSSYAQDLPGVDVELEMVAIPSGKFQMGSPQSETGRNSDEGPVREVAVEGFWMSKYEITWELYNLFIERAIDNLENIARANEVHLEADAVSGATVPYVDMSLGMGREEGFPVVNITQRAASAFCQWLSAITGHYYRLPTEAEWEYAARAGNREAYYFGKDASVLDNHAWFNANSEGRYHKVGTKQPNPWELYDMYGNVAEWTLDQYDKNGYGDAEMPFEPVVSEYPVAIRGGSFKDGPALLRSASRLASDPVWKQRDPQFPRSKWWFTDAGFVGFRIVRPFETPSEEEMNRYWSKEN